MAEKLTIFQRLTKMMGSTSGSSPVQNTTTYNFNVNPNDVIFSTKDKAERDMKELELKQQRLLSYQWHKTGYETSMEQMQGATQIKLMYRDADLMDAWPEIGSCLDILSEESTVINKEGKIVNVHSKSERIKSVLEDLFNNKLNLHIMLPMISRAMCKYGNEYMQLNIEKDNGVVGWRELPVYDIERIENTNIGQYGTTPMPSTQNATLKSDAINFVWRGHNESMTFKNWQILHFRLLTDNLFLPYGVSHLNKARRAWRMMSMMEDGMLLNRLERSIDRRVFKVNVGAIDDADVPAFLNDFMNSIKRAPIVDPKTGQIDLKKNFLDVTADYVIPVRNGQDPSEISTLQNGQTQMSTDDIELMEKKVLAALKTPKPFLNFTDKDAKGQNLATTDIRFSRTINKIQQALLLELTKVAVIHLHFLGFDDDLTNFTLTLNNPSTQLEMLEIDNLSKRIGAASSALSEQGGGIPLMSWHQVQKEIMGKSDDEIFNIINEIRLERAMAEELTLTRQIIKRTGLFNNVDRLYGDLNAQYTEEGEQGSDDMGMGGGGGAPMGGDFGGGDMLGDLGEPGSDETGDIGGDEGSTPMDEGMPMESKHNNNKLLNEKRNVFEDYINFIKNQSLEREQVEILKKTKIITESIDEEIEKLLKG